jgi:hypothetical protein
MLLKVVKIFMLAHIYKAIKAILQGKRKRKRKRKRVLFSFSISFGVIQGGNKRKTDKSREHIAMREYWFRFVFSFFLCDTRAKKVKVNNK